MLNALQSGPGGLADEEEDMPNRMTVVVLVAFMLSAVPRAGAVTVHVAGYVYVPFVNTSTGGAQDLELDALGNIYYATLSGVRQITPGGTVTPWSTAPANDIVFTGTGDAYAAGSAVCHCIEAISSSGAYSTLHGDSLSWTHVALGTDGTLYASVWAGTGKGIYVVDRASGTPTPLLVGGAGPGGSGFYESMMVGMDGKLYVGGSNGTEYGLFRFDGGQFTQIATWPHGCSGLAQDNQGIFYTSVTLTPIGTIVDHEVWMYDPGVGTANLLADGSGNSLGIAYDRARNVLYVQNGSEVYMISKSATPTLKETWSALKAKFH
jgi:hypothetical protein